MKLKNVRVKYHYEIEIMSMSVKKDPTELCSCKCHYGGAVSCPGCKGNHGVVCVIVKINAIFLILLLTS